jgi:predicted nucleic acid-binding protein
MVIVDSSVWIDYLRREKTQHTQWLANSLGSRPVGLTNVILCEVLQGIRHESRFQTAADMLISIPLFDLRGSGVAIASARNYRSLRALGITIRTTIDCLTATFCIQQGFELLHRDRDFDAFELHCGLVVVRL